MIARVERIASDFEPTDHDRDDAPDDLWARIEREIAAEAPLASTAKPLRSRRTRWMTAVGVAAAAVIIAIAAAVVTSNHSTNTVVASTDLVAVGAPTTARAHADLRRASDGRLTLVLTVHSMPTAPDGSYYELWLMDRRLTVPNSLGPMSGSLTVAIPRGVSTTAFPVVDISVQPVGHAEYSGDSVLRGTLS